MNAHRARSNAARMSWTKITKHADINTLKGFDYSDSIEYIRKRFEKIPLKFRDPRVEAALTEIETEAPSKQHFLEFMITCYRIGFWGPEVSQELLCSHIARSTHAHAFGVRTLRSAASWAIEHGYITASWIPIGKRAVKPDGDYCTQRIRRYTSTYKIRLLVSVLRADPSKMSRDSAVVLHNPTPENFSHNPNGELQGRGQLVDPLPCKLLRLDHLQDDQEQASNTVLKGTGTEEGALTAPISTCPEALRPPTCEHRASKQKASSKNELGFFRDRNRSASPVTYRNSRRNFLHELFVALKPQNQQAWTLYTIAAAQTDTFYSRYLPACLDWFDVLTQNYFSDWHQRRKQIDRDILPSLRNFATAWTPPPIDFDRPDAMRIFNDWEHSICPEPGIAIRPELLKDFYARWPYARATLSGIYSRQIDLSELQNPNSPLKSFCILYTF